MWVGLLKTIGYVFLVWWIFRWLDRMSARWRSARRDTESGSSPKTRRTANGEAPKDQNLGEYIDFEEVDD